VCSSDLQKAEPHLTFEDFEDILRKNRGRLGTIISALTGAMKNEYLKATECALRRKREIARNDWLIDQVVYWLYGLTQNDIQQVEEGRRQCPA